MSLFPAHSDKRTMRRFFAASLTVIYLVIALSPLAPFAMYSKVVAHAVTGECSGDCDICGCSQESRANHTCCCAKKKQVQARDIQLRTCDQCSSKAATADAAATGASRPAEQAVAKNDCCAKSGQCRHDKSSQQCKPSRESSRNETVYKCNCPCGKGKLLALANAGSSELLPYIYSERISHPHEATHYSPLSQRMASRYADPPIPPRDSLCIPDSSAQHREYPLKVLSASIRASSDRRTQCDLRGISL